MALTIFHLKPILLLMMKMTTKHFFLFVKKKESSVSVYLKILAGVEDLFLFQ